MVRHNLEYPRGVHNTVNRYKHQADYSLTTIHTIINTSPVLHVSFLPSPSSPFPTILPMIGQMGSFTHPSSDLSSPLDIYLHGYVSSRIMNLSRSSPQGIPVCVAASKVDGIVLTLTPYSHNYNYRSAVLFGYASLVDTEDEKLWAMELITDSVVPGRWANSRAPPTKGEMASTQILRVRVESGSGKVREGVPTDEKADVEDEEVVGSVWTGVVPMYEVMGEPVPGPYNKVRDVPDHVRVWREEGNREREGYATEAATKDAPVAKKENGNGDGDE